MIARFQSQLVALAVTVYCGWQARGLLHDWRWSPYNRWCAFAFVIWLVPLVVEYALALRANRRVEPVISLLWTGLAVSLIGSLGDLNVFCHAGFALALVGTVSWKWHRIMWLAVAVAWMPVFGWAGSKASLSISITSTLRLVIVALISGWLLTGLKRKFPTQA